MGVKIEVYRSLIAAESPEDSELLASLGPADGDLLVSEGLWYKMEFLLSETVLGTEAAYLTWREELARLSGYSPSQKTTKFPYTVAAREQEGPFNDLLTSYIYGRYLLSDQCSLLYNDFATHEAAISQRTTELFMSHYRAWMEACRLASQEGCIVFRWVRVVPSS